MSGATDAVRWGRTTIAYRYRYANRKTLAITVHPDLSVSVVAPQDTEPAAIRAKVHKRGAWIQNAWREFELYLPKQPPRRYINGETHRYLGRQYRLRAEPGEDNSVKCARGYLRVTTREPPSHERVKRLLDQWYREHAERVFRERLATCHRRAKLEGIPLPALTIRKMKSRWGSCSPNGAILLNVELIKAPKDCIDYVIMHELCHLKEHHHGPRFWKLLGRLMPDYQARRQRLNLMADV